MGIGNDERKASTGACKIENCQFRNQREVSREFYDRRILKYETGQSKSIFDRTKNGRKFDTRQFDARKKSRLLFL